MRRRGTDALLAAAVLSQRELFARLLVDPREARAAHRRLCMPGDAFPTAATRHACPRRSSNRPACADKRCLRQLLLEGGGGVTRRQPGVGLAGGGFGAEPEPWRAAASAQSPGGRRRLNAPPRRELFARPQLDPTELRVTRRRATMPGRACAAAAAARPWCRRRSSQRLACVHRRGYGAAAAWSGGTARRRPGLGLAGERLWLGAEAQGARRFAEPSRHHRALPSAGGAWGGASSLLGRSWTRRSFG